MLQAGAAKTQITPPVGILLQSGAPDIRAEGVLDDLYCCAVVLDDGSRRLAIVGCDIMDMEATLAEAVCGRISVRTGIPREGVLLNASHTHSGPAVYLSPSPDTPYLTQKERGYVAWLTERIADTVARAAAHLEPVALRVGMAEGRPFAVNRRRSEASGTRLAPNPQGTVDQRVKVLRFDRLDGSPLAILFSFACHATGFDYRNTKLITGDFVSSARAEVEQTFACQGAAPVVGFLQGCGGNVRPYVVEPDGLRFHACTPAEIHAHGRGLGAVAVRAAQEAPMVVGYPLAATWEMFPLPLQAAPTLAELRALKAESHLQGWQAVWVEAVLSRLERGETLPTHIPMAIQVLRLGGAWIVAMGGEVFVEIGLAVEKAVQEACSGQVVFALGYSNSAVGYVCTAKAYTEGGYEPVAYRWFLFPAPFHPETEHLVVEEAVRLARVGSKWTPR
jgi:neutral ceramidase